MLISKFIEFHRLDSVWLKRGKILGDFLARQLDFGDFFPVKVLPAKHSFSENMAKSGRLKITLFPFLGKI